MWLEAQKYSPIVLHGLSMSALQGSGLKEVKSVLKTNSVADPGCLTRIQIFSIPDPGSKFFSIPDPRSAQRMKYFNPKNRF
jgi:hypothetical protein